MGFICLSRKRHQRRLVIGEQKGNRRDRPFSFQIVTISASLYNSILTQLHEAGPHLSKVMLFQSVIGKCSDPRESVMIRRYIGLQEDGISARALILSSTVWSDGILPQEERPRIPMSQKKGNHHNRIKPLVGGLLLGAIAAGGVVTGLLQLKARRSENQDNTWLNWPAMSGTERRTR